MCKTLLIYYTFEGNTGYVAGKMKELCDLDTERLVVEKEPPKTGFGKFFWGGKSAIFKENPHLQPVKSNIDDYENIMIAFPVWAGTYPPAIGAFFNKYKLQGKRVYLIACSASGNAEKALTCAKQRLTGNTIAGTLSLVSPLKHREKTDAALHRFAEENGVG